MPLWPPAGSVELEMQKLGKCPCQRHSRGQFPLLVAVTCYLQSPAKADTKVVTELLQCSGYSRMLEQPPLGPKTSELKPITSTGKARGLNPASSLLGPKPSIYWCFVFYVQFTNQTQLFPQVLCNLLFCKISFTLHFWSVQFHMRATQLRWVLKSQGSKTKNLLTWLWPKALWPKYSAACTNPTWGPRAQAIPGCDVAVKAGLQGRQTVPSSWSLPRSSSLLAGIAAQPQVVLVWLVLCKMAVIFLNNYPSDLVGFLQNINWTFLQPPSLFQKSWWTVQESIWL